MKKISIITVLVLTIVSCNVQKIEQTNMHLKPVVNVTANAETDAVSTKGDAADDPCIWIHPTDVMKSTIIGTNKKKGLAVYSVDGKQLYFYPVGRVNNVDIRNNFMYKNQKVSVVTASNRTHNTITVHIVNPKTRELIDVAARPIKSNLREVYGLCMYQSKKSGKTYVFICGKKGGVEQWELFEKEGYIDAKMVRSIDVGSQTEGMVADDEYGYVYIGEENKALWRYQAEPDALNERIRVVSVRDANMKSDFEGVTIYDSGNGKGYIILSSQGNNSYAVFDRVTNLYKGSFRISDAGIDGVIDTDGIDVTSVAFGEKYPKGFFIAQDYDNTDGAIKLNQNFKIVDWQKIAGKLGLNK